MADVARADRREVRNPVLALSAAKRMQALPNEVRAELAGLFSEIKFAAHEKAEASWIKNKGPMAAYWKAVGAYAEHIRRVVRPGAPPPLQLNAQAFEEPPSAGYEAAELRAVEEAAEREPHGEQP